MYSLGLRDDAMVFWITQTSGLSFVFRNDAIQASGYLCPRLQNLASSWGRAEVNAAEQSKQAKRFIIRTHV